MDAERGPAARSSDVVVEVVFLRYCSGRWHYRPASCPLPARTDPEQTARALAGLGPVADPSTVLHSTSWRYRAAGHVVLTYAVLPDPDPHAPAHLLQDFDIARGTRADQPSPADIQPHHVAAHAIRHLAMLRDTDPAVAAARGIECALAKAAPAPGGRLG